MPLFRAEHPQLAGMGFVPWHSQKNYSDASEIF